MKLDEAKTLLKENGYLLTEAKYKYTLTVTFYTAEAAYEAVHDFYGQYKNNAKYRAAESSINYIIFFYFNEQDDVKKFINQLVEDDKVEKFDLHK